MSSYMPWNGRDAADLTTVSSLGRLKRSDYQFFVLEWNESFTSKHTWDNFLGSIEEFEWESPRVAQEVHQTHDRRMEATILAFKRNHRVIELSRLPYVSTNINSFMRNRVLSSTFTYMYLSAGCPGMVTISDNSTNVGNVRRLTRNDLDPFALCKFPPEKHLHALNQK